ncbi:MAG: dTMP kinase [Candidatus ainarchaeum sp.]|nr:dTMP kinase [Candidatus ainarchaeum sp.]
MKGKKGLLIAFEGIDGSGKAVQSGLLTEWLKRGGRTVIDYTYPDLRSRYGDILDEFLKGRIPMDEKTQLLTFAADIMKDQEQIGKRLARGEIIVMDRYITSTIAYQCAKGVPMFDALRLVKMLQPIAPDAVVWLDIPPALGVRRRKNRKGKRKRDLHDSNLRLLSKVRANYGKLYAMKWLGRKWARINGKKPIAEIHEEIRDLITPLMK